MNETTHLILVCFLRPSMCCYAARCYTNILYIKGSLDNYFTKAARVVDHKYQQQDSSLASLPSEITWVVWHGNA